MTYPTEYTTLDGDAKFELCIGTEEAERNILEDEPESIVHSIAEYCKEVELWASFDHMDPDYEESYESKIGEEGVSFVENIDYVYLSFYIEFKCVKKYVKKVLTTLINEDLYNVDSTYFLITEDELDYDGIINADETHDIYDLEKGIEELLEELLESFNEEDIIRVLMVGETPDVQLDTIPERFKKTSKDIYFKIDMTSRDDYGKRYWQSVSEMGEKSYKTEELEENKKL